jgi:CHAT domain-containing protein/tetratricopeptide (TPR) repeat protein
MLLDFNFPTNYIETSNAVKVNSLLYAGLARGLCTATPVYGAGSLTRRRTLLTSHRLANILGGILADLIFSARFLEGARSLRCGLKVSKMRLSLNSALIFTPSTLLVIVLLAASLLVAQQPGPTPVPAELDSLKQELAGFQQSGDLANQIRTLSKIGLYYRNNKEYGQAADCFNQALAISVKVGDTHWQAIMHYSLGLTAKLSGDREAERQQYEAGLKIFRAETDENSQFFIARTLYDLATLSRDENDIAAAIKFREEALSIFRQIKEGDNELSALIKLADDYRAAGNLNKSLDLYTQLQKLYEARGDKRNLAYVVSFIAQVQNQKGDKRAAADSYENAVQRCRDAGIKLCEGDGLRALGTIYTYFGDFKKALSYFQAAVTSYHAAGDAVTENRVSGDLASLYVVMGDFANARLQIEKNIATSSQIGDKASEASGWAQRSLLDLYTGKFSDALTHAEMASKIAEDNKLTVSKSLILTNLSVIYTTIGLNEKAVQTAEDLLETFANEKDTVNVEEALVLAASAYRRVPDLAKAEEYLKRALSISQKLGDKVNEITILNQLGDISVRRRDLSAAEAYFQQALKVNSQVKSRMYEAVTMGNLAFLYAMEGRHDQQTLDTLLKALALADEQGFQTLVAQDLGGLMVYWDKASNPGLAIFYGKQAVNLLQSLRGTLQKFDKQAKQAYVAQFEKAYRTLADILVRQGRIPEAEAVLAMLKQEEYFDFVRRDAGEAGQLLAKVSLSPEEQKAFEEYRKYSDQLTAMGKEYGELQNESLSYDVGKFPKQARLDELEKLIANANKVFNIFLDDLKKSLGEKDVRVGTVESGTQALLKEIDEPRTVFISTISADDRLNIILTTASVQKAYTVDIKVGDMNKLVEDFRKELRNPTIDPRPAGKALYDKLFPVELKKDIDAVKADTILWSLDGTLRYVPMAALWDGNKYLVESYKNVEITLASTKYLTEPANRTGWKMLGAGVSRAATVTDVAGIERSFPALAAVPDELCRVVDDPLTAAGCKPLDGGKPGVIAGKELLDDQFTFSSFQASVARYPVVHISSHFSLNPGNENDSFLLLGGGDNRKLTLDDIRTKKVNFANVNLLTLSACNTGMASAARSNGVEVEGFGALAQMEGARSVLASLWSVADTSTRDLMVEFYRQLGSNSKVTKADALRNAQLALLYGSYKLPDSPGDSRGASYTSTATGKPFVKDPKAPFAHPYYWSPFILMGNWK